MNMRNESEVSLNGKVKPKTTKTSDSELSKRPGCIGHALHEFDDQSLAKMDEYQHPLFFEAKDLKDKEKGKIRRYFQIRRESGGGDCGAIEEAEGNTYKICFKEKEDQVRVLLRKFHTISLPCGEVRLTVSREMPSQSGNLLSSSSSQTFPKANAKCLEKVFPLDLFLLYFLRDNPKAIKVLQKQLSCIGCTVELDFDNEEAVVRGDIEKAPGGAFGVAEKWDTQVDRVFTGVSETYCCYTAVEPKEVKILLEDPSFVTDEIKVYSESGYVVVVGDVQAVNERISMVQKTVHTQKELPIAEKQFKLVKEEFSREMCAYFPKVKILIEHARITLEGPNKDVQSGATKLEELMKKVKEKRVKLRPAVLSFIKSSDVIPKYEARFQQCLRNPVSLEVGSDLLLCSLSSEALDEAEVAVRRELAAEHLQLQGVSAVDLDTAKEILNKAKNRANSREFRVDFSFIQGPGTAAPEVLLVGYSEGVKKLKEVLHEYQMNQVTTQEVLKLPHPELLNCLNELVNLIGMKQTEVTLTTSSYPYPCVLVSGPRCLVQETQQALSSALDSLMVDTLVLDGPGAQRYFQAEGRVAKELVESSCQVLIREQQSLQCPSVAIRPESTRSPGRAASGPFPGPSSMAAESIAVNKPSLEIRLGSLEDQQVNVLVVPMINRKLTSTKIGKSLLTKAGNEIQWRFDSMAAIGVCYPGDVLQVDAPSSLGCSKLFFVECLPWDGVSGMSVQVLIAGLKRCLDLCVQQGLCSVAFPIIGHGVVLRYPLKEAVQVLTDNIQQFGLTASPGPLSSIHIVIKPDSPDSEECYYEVFRHLSLNMNQGGQAIFKSLSSDLDDLTVTVGGGVKLKLVFGDITNETTDAVVNMTDTNYQNGVCRDILSVAGPAVEAELKAGKVSRGKVLVTGPGSFPTSAIFHVCGEKDVRVIEKQVLSIVENCEAFWFRSVAIPAICAGAGGQDPRLVAGAVLRGVGQATSSSIVCLTDIRIVLNKIKVFLAFKEEVMQMFPSSVIDRGSVPPSPGAQPGQQASPSESADPSALCASSAGLQSVFLFLGLSRVDVDDAMTKLKDLYQAQCSTKTFKEEELAGLTQDNVEDLKQLMELEGLYVQRNQAGRGTLAVSGLKDGVSKVVQMINASLQISLRREVRAREEEDLFNRVAWCIQRHGGNWERLPKTANHNLENNRVAGGIVDAQDTRWTVDPRRTEATDRPTGQTAKLKRLEHLSDFTFPLYWDNMAAGEAFKKVTLQPSSAEYQTVKNVFKQTVQKTVMKIERLQNIHLRRAYEVQKKHICDKNQQRVEAGEKLLYHGTTQVNCDSIGKTGFNRSFSGQNGTAYGNGTYFAVDASYSANPLYSVPSADGSQLMFVVRVATGVYAAGQSNMRAPPTRGGQHSHERYDSVVDNAARPSMYVVFHDDQAYPDYLITFK